MNRTRRQNLFAGWYLLRQPNGADRLLWLEQKGELWTFALSPADAQAGQIYATLSDAALCDASPKPLETGPHAATLSAWESSAISL